MTTLSLRFLGTPLVELEGTPLDIDRVKSVALLAYLALTAESHSRGALAALLWPDFDAERSAAALRNAIWRLSRRLGDAWLDADRTNVRVRPGAAIWIDVTRFEQLLGPVHGRALRSTEPPSSEPLAALTDAAALYRGDFLQGLSLRDCPAFDDWQTFQREHLRGRIASALDRLIAGHLAAGRLEQALPCAQRFVALDPLNEEAHRLLMQVHARSGRRAEALKQYKACAAALGRELGVKPQEETIRLRDAIRAEENGTTAAPSVGATPGPEGAEPEPVPATDRPSALPGRMTTLVGREGELAILAQRLDDPACRLLTITGPGGVGKTALALEAARRTEGARRDGACFVPLAGVGAPELLAAAIAAALALPPSGAKRVDTQVFGYLQVRRLLLVLDNFEHLVDGAGFVAELLERAPSLQIVVTSRERLALRGEWEVILDGLPCARDTAPGSGAHDATELFVRIAMRARASFVPADDWPAIARICRLVGGMPLGIELAAAWVRNFSPAEIAAQLEKDSSFLLGARDAPERQQSMRASFAHSWRLSSPAEQGVLRRLSVFRGGATQAAAEQVSGATLASLMALCGRFLVRRTPAGRYDLHELIRQYAAEELDAAPAEKDDTYSRHADWYAVFLDRERMALEGPLHVVAIATIEAELDNIRAAWRWAIDNGRFGALALALDGLSAAHEARGRFREAEAALGEAVAAVRRAGGDDLRLLLGRLLARRGNCALEFLPLDEAAALIDESMRLLRAIGDRDELSFALDAAGRLALLQGDHAAARWAFRASLAIARARGDRRASAGALRDLSAVALRLGDFKKAERLLRKGLAVFRELDDARGAATCLSGLGDVLGREGEWKRAEAAYRDGLRVLRRTGESCKTAALVGRVARSLCALEELDAARRSYDECLEMGRSMAHPETIAAALHGLGIVALRRDDREAARAHFEESLALWQKLSARQGIAEALTALGLLAAVEGAPDRAHASYLAALRTAMEIGATPLVLEILIGVSELPGIAAGTAARRALAAICVHPAAEWDTRNRAARLLARGKARPNHKIEPIPELPSLVAAVLAQAER
jgi:predicted ATPase/DNA-binding SARP family transcriptional activator